MHYFRCVLTQALIDAEELTISNNLLTGTLPSVPATDLSVIGGGNPATIRLSKSTQSIHAAPSHVLIRRSTEKVDISSNQLHGPIPDFIAAIPTLSEWLRVASCVTGRGCLTHFSATEFLDVSGNQFTGALPNNPGAGFWRSIGK